MTKKHCYELLCGSGAISSSDWQGIILKLAHFLPMGQKWHIIAKLDHNILRYYIQSKSPLPVSFGSKVALLKKCKNQDFSESAISGLCVNRWSDNIAILINKISCKGLRPLFFVVDLQIFGSKIHSHTKVICRDGDDRRTKCLLLSQPTKLLAVDFKQHQNLTYKKIPKYTKVEKLLPFLQDQVTQAILEIQTYPYMDQAQYLSLPDYDFHKHSFIIGGSGMGKSKFIANFIHQVYQVAPQAYQFVVIDPHAALKDDLTDLERTVVNFMDLSHSINLFASVTSNIGVGVELLLSLLKTLIADNYNSRLERVLRYSIYVLLAHQSFSFLNLRQLILDLEYRNQLLSKKDIKLPVNVQQFFLTDFQELKSQAYNIAFAPIISFVDEMLMVPVFNVCPPSQTLQQLLEDNFLTIFSLDRLELGDKVVRTIAGLIMQQLFSLAEQRILRRQLIIIIDEVSVVENPILTRFLSELRKFNVSVILAGQYFAQITPELRSAILANTSNYYIFRTSKSDAMMLAQNLDIKPANGDDPGDQPKLITGLKPRECIVQIDHRGEILPAFKAKSLDLVLGETITEKVYHVIEEPLAMQTKAVAFDFVLDDIDVHDIMKQNSTSRKKI